MSLLWLKRLEIQSVRFMRLTILMGQCNACKISGTHRVQWVVKVRNNTVAVIDFLSLFKEKKCAHLALQASWQIELAN